MRQVCDVCCKRACALHFLTFVIAGLFVLKMMTGKGYDVVNWEKVMEDADPQQVFCKQSQLCAAAKEIIDVLPHCDMSFSSIFNYRERADLVDLVGDSIEQAGNPAVDVGCTRKQVELAHPDREKRCFLSHCPFHSPSARGAHILASDEYAVPLASAFCRTVWCKCASFVVLMCTLWPVINLLFLQGWQGQLGWSLEPL